MVSFNCVDLLWKCYIQYLCNTLINWNILNLKQKLMKTFNCVGIPRIYETTESVNERNLNAMKNNESIKGL